MAASACSLLPRAELPDPLALYALDMSGAGAATAASAASAVRGAPLTAPVTAAVLAPTLVVGLPQAAPGFDSARMIYVRQPHRLEYFARSEWVDTPARMLLPLLVAALAPVEAFAAVVPAQSSAAGALRLDTEVLLLQQEFGGGPSRVRFALRARVVAHGDRQVLASRSFEAVVPSASEDPYGGVLAANAAVQSVLDQLVPFCAEASQRWQARSVQDGRPKFIVQ
jgi:cholesterol transport system auxiliary component